MTLSPSPGKITRYKGPHLPDARRKSQSHISHLTSTLAIRSSTGASDGGDVDSVDVSIIGERGIRLKLRGQGRREGGWSEEGVGGGRREPISSVLSKGGEGRGGG